MSVDVFRAVLGWCTIINYGVLVWWFLVFNALHYAGMAIYKVGVLLFNFVPYVALLIVGRRVKQ